MPTAIQDQDPDTEMDMSAFLESEYDPSTCKLAPGLTEEWLAADHARIEKIAHAGVQTTVSVRRPLQLRGK